jgi:hypothetical protein
MSLVSDHKKNKLLGEIDALMADFEAKLPEAQREIEAIASQINAHQWQKIQAQKRPVEAGPGIPDAGQILPQSFYILDETQDGDLQFLIMTRQRAIAKKCDLERRIKLLKQARAIEAAKQ